MSDQPKITGEEVAADIQCPVYCGCWHSLGHMLFSPGMKRLAAQGVGPWKYLDSSSLNPGGRHGAAQLTWADAWTALGITDYSVDRRPGAHATFAMPGRLDFEQAMVAIRTHYPEVIARIEDIDAIRLVQHSGSDAAEPAP